MQVLVTGGSGYVGSVVCRHLARQHEVTNFDRTPPAESCGRFVRGDINDSAHLMEAMSGVDAVVHLAAIPHPNMDTSDAIMQANVMGTQRVVAAAAHGSPKRLVLASSDSSFGFVFGQPETQPQYLPVDECHPCRPRDSYGLSKLLGEEICRRYTRATGLETICLRYCWVWNDEHYAMLANIASQPATFTGQLWGYVDVRDVAQAIGKSLEAPGITHETLLIAANDTFAAEISLDLAEAHLPDGIELRDETWFADNPHRCLFDCTRAEQTIGFEPEYDCWEHSSADRDEISRRDA